MPAPPFIADAWSALGGRPDALDRIRVVGRGDLPSAHRVTDLAVAGIGVAALAVSELMTDAAALVTVDRAVASAWYGWALEPVGWRLPDPWDPLSRSFPTADGWIRLHTNAAHHRRAALAVLGVVDEASPGRGAAERGLLDAVGAAVARWGSVALEDAVVASGGCAAAMRTRDEWMRHPQGVAVAAEPLVDWSTGETGVAGPTWDPSPERPLAGLRVLDLTRVIAGPVATRFLAGLGADVLRVDPPGWDEDALVPDMTLGKRTARVDATTPAGLGRLRALLRDADVLVHGYRPGALDRLGLDERQERRPGLVDVSLDAYGPGPWAGRRGFDSLVQLSCGIAAGPDGSEGAGGPVPLPVQALDHTAGYLLAAAVLRGLVIQGRTGRGILARTSLAAVAELLVGAGAAGDAIPLRPVRHRTPLDSAFGPALLLPPPATIDGVVFGFGRGPVPLGSDAAGWEGDPVGRAPLARS